MTRYTKLAMWRPEHPDRAKYHFNCCEYPDVWETQDGGAECRGCGFDWSGAKP